MTTTPRTDTCEGVLGYCGDPEAEVLSLARQLERELAAKDETIARLREALADFVGYVSAGDDKPLQAMLDEARALIRRLEGT